ncbi:MAG: hypothetical protein CL768_00375 [Chloroflexi bacterium]|nr:hypothetical protein [Chloroflexota bacterium]
MKYKILVTGANGNLGKNFLLSNTDYQVCAVVRSEKAKDDLMSFVNQNNIQNTEVVNCNYLDLPSLKKLAKPCRYFVHLVGTIKENQQNKFDFVHGKTTEAVLEAIKDTGIEKSCYISILGSNETSNNRCFASRGLAEKAFLDSEIPCLILQVPMVLGKDDYASLALKKNALSKIALTFRKASLEQPIYANDIIEVIKKDIKRSLLRPESTDGIRALAGPTALTREKLIHEVAKIIGVRVRVISLPITLGYAIAKLLEFVSSNPPVTKDMLEVLDHDDNIDPTASSHELGIKLTSLEVTLKNIFI